jgi:hypothetical protein
MPEKDQNSLPIDGEQGGENGGGAGGGKVESEADGGFVRMYYTTKAHVDLSDASIDIFFANPYKSNRSVVLELYITYMNKDYLVAKSGRVDAGYGLRTATFNEKINLVPTTDQRIYKGKYVVRFYDPDSGERAVVTSVIDEVVFTVSE